MSDFTQYDDAELNQLLNDVINEQERRANVARIPTEMATMQAKFLAGGGDPEVIAAALAAPLPSAQPDPAPEPTPEAPDPAEGDSGLDE